MKLFRLTLKSLVLLVVCFVVAGSLLPTAVEAQAVGSHLGEGDFGAQIRNIQILKSNGAGSGFPVTALVDINAAYLNEEGMQKLAQAIRSADFTPIVRIMGVCSSSSGGNVPTQAVNNIRSVFSSNHGVYIVYGNEVNNQDHECANWSAYVSEYQGIANKNNVSPSPLDFYMGVPKYAANEFLKTPGASAMYASASFNAANAYECVGKTSSECKEPWSDNTKERGYSYYKNNLVLTEFSLSPEGGSSSAPDTDLKNVIAFIQEKASETGASLITPLVRNVCNDEGEWLLYVNGQLFTTAGTNVTENCDPSNMNSTFDLSMFPMYGYDPTQYYLHPIQGVNPNAVPQGGLVSKIRGDLANQGYEAICAAPQTSIRLDLNTRDLIERFVKTNQPKVVNQSIESKYHVDSREGLYPIFRDTTGVRYLATSLEEYFGFKDVYTDQGYSFMELNTAPLDSLLSKQQRCKQGVDIIKNIQLMCERLADPGSCALLQNEIPGTSQTVQTMLGDIAKVIPAYRAGGITDGCKKLFAGDDMGGIAPAELEKFKEEVVNIPLVIDRSFRLAFLVVSVEQRPKKEAFNFFNYSEDAKPADDVIMVAFKIPDILTNKGGRDEGGDSGAMAENAGHFFFNDAATLTRDVLVPKNFRGLYDLETNLRRKEVFDNAKSAALQGEGSKIWCVSNAGNTEEQLSKADGSRACKDVVGKAVVDIINGNTPNCDKMEAEPVLKIFQDVRIANPPAKDNPSRVYTPEYGIDFLNFILKYNEFPSVSGESFNTVFNIVDDKFLDAEGEKTDVNFYLVYPIGYELESVTNVLRDTFFTQSQIAELEKSNLKQRFETKKIDVNLFGGVFSHTFDDVDKPGGCPERTRVISEDPQTHVPLIPPIEISEPDCSETFTIKVVQDGKTTASVQGAELGFWLRNIQRQLNTHFGAASAYVASCRTMEEFLTGNCIGRALASSPGASLGGSSTVTPLCGKNYPIQADDIKPDYNSRTILSSNEAGYSSQVPKNPDKGKAAFYGAGLMNQVLKNRKSWGQINPANKITDCEGKDPKYAGCIALLRAGDIDREVYMKGPTGRVEGPFLVVDVAARQDIACLLERSWVVDVDRETGKRWGMQGLVDVKICDTKAACN